MEDFSADILREVTLPLGEKPLYSAPVTLNNRHKADVKVRTRRWFVFIRSSSREETEERERSVFVFVFQVQKKPLSIRDELTFDLIRPKKKCGRRERLCPPQRRPGRPPGPYTVNKADIKQYDFHSSGEDDSPPPPLVSLRLSVSI